MLLPLLVHVGADEVQHSQAGQLGEGHVKGFAVGTPEANAHLEGNGVPLHALCQFALRPKLVQRIWIVLDGCLHALQQALDLLVRHSWAAWIQD